MKYDYDPHYDPRYAYVVCATCGKRWQNIDFGCAVHKLMCDNPQRQIENTKPTCRICGEEGHPWRRCGKD